MVVQENKSKMERLTIKEKQILQEIKQHIAFGAPIEILNYKQDYVGIQYSKANGYYMLAGDIHVTYDGGSTGKSVKDFRFLLRPLSSLTEEINWGNQTYAITDLFEIGDDGGYIYEYDHGNIKLISQLKTIAEYNYHHDINYLPYPVVQVLIEHHFDVFGLIDRGLALPIDGKEVEGD